MCQLSSPDGRCAASMTGLNGIMMRDSPVCIRLYMRLSNQNPTGMITRIPYGRNIATIASTAASASSITLTIGLPRPGVLLISGRRARFQPVDCATDDEAQNQRPHDMNLVILVGNRHETQRRRRPQGGVDEIADAIYPGDFVRNQLQWQQQHDPKTTFEESQSYGVGRLTKLVVRSANARTRWGSKRSGRHSQPARFR